MRECVDVIEQYCCFVEFRDAVLLSGQPWHRATACQVQ